MHPHLIQFEPDPQARAAQLKVKEWVREVLTLPPETLITLSEMHCPDPACPVVETVVIVHRDDGLKQYRFAHPKAALTKMHVIQGLSNASPVE